MFETRNEMYLAIVLIVLDMFLKFCLIVFTRRRNKMPDSGRPRRRFRKKMAPEQIAPNSLDIHTDEQTDSVKAANGQFHCVLNKSKQIRFVWKPFDFLTWFGDCLDEDASPDRVLQDAILQVISSKDMRVPFDGRTRAGAWVFTLNADDSDSLQQGKIVTFTPVYKTLHSLPSRLRKLLRPRVHTHNNKIVVICLHLLGHQVRALATSVSESELTGVWRYLNLMTNYP